ncbi:MAG TPA: lysophospholipid acyltransferase family protein [Thermoanaerobaculia bacterium]|nr:lysophospholipid acyltransferase family protein [Thermoanaerobaculia bacterium]
MSLAAATPAASDAAPAATGAPEPPSFGARLAAKLIWLFLATLGGTLRPRWSGGERFHAIVRERRPTILIVWHHQLFLASWLIWKFGVLRGLPVLVLISRSRDGTLGTEVGRLLRAEVARGSTSRGGGPALRQLVRALAAGRTVLLIPDGPRGPARELKPGVVALAELGRVPVLPLAMAADRAWRLRSWDRMVIPKPFSRLEVLVGEERRLAGLDEGGREAARRELQDELDRLTLAAEHV